MLPPVAAAAQLGGRRGRVLLHSASAADDLGRWSFVTAEPTATLLARGTSCAILDAAGRPSRRFTADPLDAAEQFLADAGCRLDGPADAAPAPRVIGYLGYDLARSIDLTSASPGGDAARPGRARPFDSLPAGPQAGANVPDLWLGAYPAVARWAPDGGFDLVGDAAACRRLADALGRAPARPVGVPPSFGPLAADDADDLHLARVDRILDYLVAGDAYQVCLARRLVARIAAPGDALAVYAALADVAPAAYGALIELDGGAVVSGSPERFLARVGDRIETRPIKGTRPVDPDGAVDGAVALAASAKDAAEHLMIVDLERNDLGRIAELGSVRVDRFGYVVDLPALHHLVSRVSARPRAGTGYAALLRATFPGGSITGTPKLRAMQIIDELEPARRGPYCGAIGYFGAGGFDLAIAIRIGVIAARELHVHVGGGIVADSTGRGELAETETKAAGWRAALARLSSPGR